MVGRFLLNESYDAPSVEIDRDAGLIELRGKSNVPDPVAFFREIIAKIEDYMINPMPETTINLRLTYLNTSSSKWIFHILKQFENQYSVRTRITINWFYDDDDETMHDAGEDFQSLVKVPFNLISI